VDVNNSIFQPALAGLDDIRDRAIVVMACFYALRPSALSA